MRHKITKEHYDALLEDCFSEVFEVYVGHRYFLAVVWNEETYVGTLFDCDGCDFHSVENFFSTQTTYGSIKDGKPVFEVKRHRPNHEEYEEDIRSVHFRYDDLADAQAHAIELLAIAMTAYNGEDLPEFKDIPRREPTEEEIAKADEELEASFDLLFGTTGNFPPNPAAT